MAKRFFNISVVILSLGLLFVPFSQSLAFSSRSNARVDYKVAILQTRYQEMQKYETKASNIKISDLQDWADGLLFHSYYYLLELRTIHPFLTEEQIPAVIDLSNDFMNSAHQAMNKLDSSLKLDFKFGNNLRYHQTIDRLGQVKNTLGNIEALSAKYIS